MGFWPALSFALMWGVKMPAYGLMSDPCETTVAQQIGGMTALLVLACIVTLAPLALRRVTGTPAHSVQLVSGLQVVARWITVACGVLYPSMVLAQAYFQLLAAGAVPV